MALAGALNAIGLDTHETALAATEVTSLGIKLIGLTAAITPTPERDARPDAALRCLIAGRAVTSQELGIVVGHATVRCLINMGPLLYHPPSLRFHS